MGRQYRENGARRIYIYIYIYAGYNQMRPYVECSPNQSKKNYSFMTFPSSNLQNFEDSGIVLAVYVSQFQEYCSSALTAQAHKIVITTVCVDNCFCYT